MSENVLISSLIEIIKENLQKYKDQRQIVIDKFEGHEDYQNDLFEMEVTREVIYEAARRIKAEKIV